MNVSILASNMKILYENININKKIIELESHKHDLLIKKNLVSDYIYNLRFMTRGKLTNILFEDMKEFEANFQSLHENFDDRLMVFIIGAGNVGKSTLLNSLVGYEVAKTGILPVTWKIDVYSPESDLQTATIKYRDGKTNKIHIEEAKKIISEEESKAKKGKKDYNTYFQKEIETVRDPELIKELERHHSEKYIYTSPITEVRWPVRNNWLLEKCMLVDTPGFNQIVNSNLQFGNIHDYYHKADGILWLVDGITISAANPSETLEELNHNLFQVGGLRHNIIGVINGMDKVRQNGGEESVRKVTQSAQSLYKDKFSKTLGISAKLAFEGIRDNKHDIIEESGILDLQTAIRDLFITKSEELKHGAKELGKRMLVSSLKGKLGSYIASIDEHAEKYIEVEEKLDMVSEALLSNMKSSLNDFYQNYINEVAVRIDKNIDALGEGKNYAFVISEIYKVTQFTSDEEIMIKKVLEQISQAVGNWRKFSMISEYKYIQSSANIALSQTFSKELNFDRLSSLKYFSPAVESDIVGFIGNIIGELMFKYRKPKIKIQLLKTMQENCDRLRESRYQELDQMVKSYKSECHEILDQTFKDLMFPHIYVEKVANDSQQLSCLIDEPIMEVDFYDLLTYSSKI